MRGARFGDMLPREKVLDFNALKCHSLRFRVFWTGYWPGFKVKAWKIYFYFLNVTHLSKVRPFYVRGGNRSGSAPKHPQEKVFIIYKGKLNESNQMVLMWK